MKLDGSLSQLQTADDEAGMADQLSLLMHTQGEKAHTLWNI